MLDHMVECSGLHQSPREQSKSMKGNRCYQILQIGKEKRDARPVIVTLIISIRIKVPLHPILKSMFLWKISFLSTAVGWDSHTKA